MPRVRCIVVVALLVALAAADGASARVSASGEIARLQGKPANEVALDLHNTGDEIIRCMRFDVAEGAELFDAIGPGRTTVMRPRSFASQELEIAPGAVARWEFTTRDAYPAAGRLFVSSTCQAGSDVEGSVSAALKEAEPDFMLHLFNGEGPLPRQPDGAVQGPLPGHPDSERRRGRRARGSVVITVAGTDVRISRGRFRAFYAGRLRLRLTEPLPCRRRRLVERLLRVYTGTERVDVDARYANLEVSFATTLSVVDGCRRTTVRVERGEARVTARSGRSVTARAGQRVVALPPRTR